MKTSAFIIRNNGEVIAKTDTDLRNGADCIVSWFRCEEAINANRQYNLVNAVSAKISRAKKWENVWAMGCASQSAEELNPGEFYIVGE